MEKLAMRMRGVT